MTTSYQSHGQHRARQLPGEPLERASAARLRRRSADLGRSEAEFTTDLSAIMAAVDAGIITADATGRVRSLNAAAVRTLGQPIDDLADFLGPLGIRSTAVGGGPDTVELHYLRRPERWLEVTSHPRGIGAAPSVIVVRDVTESRRSQGLREAFLGMLSHELRTPVTSIFAAANLLRSGSVNLDAAERDGLVGDIAEEADRLLRLVEDLLVLAHFDEGIDLVKSPCLIQRVVPPIVERERRRWPNVAIDLHVDVSLPVVTGDETSVQQVVRNLISNAAKYGLGEPVTVELVHDETDGGAIVRVLDSGPGVSPQESEALFRPFFRSARTARASSSAGIGLYVCRQLVEAMGGYIWARRRPDRGSEFGFWLREVEYEDQFDDLELGPERRAGAIAETSGGDGHQPQARTFNPDRPAGRRRTSASTMMQAARR